MSATTFGKWYWADWMSDPGVRASSYAARGLWMDMLCIMAQAEPVGSLVLNGRGLDPAALARLTGGDSEQVETLLVELEANGVFARDRNGNIFNRRMKKDAKKAKTAAKNGRMGGNPNLRTTKEISSSDNPPDKPPDNGGDTTHGNKPDTRYQEANASGAREARKRVVDAFRELAPQRLVPDTNRVAVWIEQGYPADLIVAVVRDVLARKPSVGSLSYFDRPLADARAAGGRGEAHSPPAEAAPSPEQIRTAQFAMALAHYRGEWRQGWPDNRRPGHPSCTTPTEILSEAKAQAARERGDDVEEAA